MHKITRSLTMDDKKKTSTTEDLQATPESSDCPSTYEEKLLKKQQVS